MVSPLSSIVAGLGPQRSGMENFGQNIQNLTLGNQQRQLNDQRLQANQFNQQQAQKQVSQEEGMRNAQYLNRLGKTLLNSDESQWGQILSPHIPLLVQMGYNPQQLAGLNREQIGSVVQQTDAVIGSTTDQLKTRSSKTFANGAVLQNTDQGVRVFDPSGKLVTGDSARKVLETAYQSEIELAGGKKGASTRADLEVRGELEPEVRGDIKTAEKQAEAEIKKQEEAPKARARLAASMKSSDDVISKVDSALSNVGQTTTGVIGSVLDSVPGTPAYDLKQTVLTVKANLGFDRLQQMRENSPTGGALGQVAVQELEALQATVASLDLRQSPEQLRENLMNIKRHYENYKNAVNASYQDRYGGKGEFTTKSGIKYTVE